MSTPKKAAKAAPPVMVGRTLEELTVSGALTKAAAACDLLNLAEEHFEGREALKWMHLICLGVIEDALDEAKAAYAKVVGAPMAVAS